jgi:hypothetical protein
MKRVDTGGSHDVLNLANWNIDNPGGGISVGISSITVDNDVPTIVLLGLDTEMTNGVSYEVQTQNLQTDGGADLEVGYESKAYNGIGVLPKVVSATGYGTYVRIVFDSSMSDIGLTEPTNYSFAGPTSLTTDYVIKQSATTVDVYTVEEQQQGGGYAVTVFNVTDTSKNTLDPAFNSAGFTGVGVGPRLMSAASSGIYSVKLTFNEAIDQTTAELAANYSIVGGGNPLAVTSASKTSSTQVELTTAEQTLYQVYTVTVSNVEDLAGNPIAPPYNTKNFVGLGKTFPVITIDPEDGSSSVQVDRYAKVNVKDLADYFSGINKDKLQIYYEYDIVAGGVPVAIRVDVVVDGVLQSAVNGEMDGDGSNSLGITTTFIPWAGWRSGISYTLTVVAEDMDGYSATEISHFQAESVVSDCSMNYLWQLIPDRMRDLDSDNDNALSKFIEVLKPAMAYICEKTAEFTNLRDPLTVRTSHDENVAIHIASHSVNDDVVTLRVADSDDLTDVSSSWVLVDEDNGEFPILAVRKRIQGSPEDYQHPELDIAGVVPPSYTVGTGEQIVRPQSIIEHLAADYGLEVDHNEAEGFQRSAVFNAFQYLDLKGSVAAYKIRGLISGFSVKVIPLWVVPEDMVSVLPGGSAWKSPDDGLWYTDVAPTIANFDDIVGDEIPCDQFCWESPSDYIFDTIAGSVTVNDLGDDGWECVLPVTADVGMIQEVGLWKVVDDAITTPEDVGDGDGSTSRFLLSLARDSVAPGTFSLEYISGGVTKHIVDDGNGVLTGDVEADYDNKIDYYNGELDFSCSDIPDASTDLTALYAREFWIERIDASGASPKLYLADYSISPLVNGDHWKLRYACAEGWFCWYCKSNKIRIEIEAEGVLTEPGADPDSDLSRLVKKLMNDIVPAHVQVAFMAYKTYVKAYMDYSVTLTLYPTTKVDAFMVNRFDAIEGSEGT